ncbi:MAG: hypothetical protein CMH56_05890, partial [Myxococcales bacterium]|nr:hypothetical protein [Myxococcales bacterium]
MQFWIRSLYVFLALCCAGPNAQAETTGDLSNLSDAEQQDRLFDSSDPRAKQGKVIGSRGINPGWKNRWVAERSPNIYGQTGLIRINSARAGKNGYFDIGIHARTFMTDDFILQGADTNTYADQSITFGFSVWDALEVGFATRAASNENSLLTPRVTFAVGDFATSIKYAFDLDPVVLAADVRGFLPAGSDRVGIAFDQMSLTGSFLATLDLYQTMNFPLRAHTNIGYAFQNSNRTLQLSDVHLDNASHFVTLTTNQWYYDQIVYGIGIEAPLPYVTPFIEFFAHTPVNVDRTFDYLQDSVITLTPGARLSIGRGLHIDTGVDLGVGGFNAIQGQPINPQWAAQLALAYTFSPFVAETQVEVREKEWSMGKISGCVVDAETELAVQEAYLEFVGAELPRIVVNEDACFTSPLLPGGEIALKVRHPDYKMGMAKLQVVPQGNESYQLPLVAAPRFGRFYGTVTNFQDEPLKADLRITNKKGDSFIIKAEDGTYDTSL